MIMRCVCQVGESYKSDDCSETCTCETAGANLVCEDTSCQGNFVCGQSYGQPTCQCLPPFVGTGDVCEGMLMLIQYATGV